MSDEIAGILSEVRGSWVPTIVVDSMQVYREIPRITNQERERPAELVSVTSVTDEWTMARHRTAADEILAGYGGPFVLDAGTGMYLNALILDIDVAPRVPEEVRREAEESATSAANPRRAARERELALIGAPARGSIWSGALRYEVDMIYIRPERTSMDEAISRRSRRISREGLQEADVLRDLEVRGLSPNPSVRASIGVRELMDVVAGSISLDEAEGRISTRTRRLARRQVRWFDKLAHALRDRVRLTVVSDVKELPPLNTMFDILRS